MGKIIGSMIASGLGVFFLFNGQSIHDPVQMLIGGFLQFAAFLVFLGGIKEYFIDDILAELKQIAKNGTPPAPDARSQPMVPVDSPVGVKLMDSAS